MQKQSMFQSFLKKKQLISKMITQSKSLNNRQQFKHFQAISQPVYIKAQSNAIYLTHLNTQFKDQLRQFVHQQQSYNETIFQLAKITENIENQKNQLEKTFKSLRNEANQVELDKQVLSDKNNFHLDKIMTLQQQAKSLQVRAEEYEKIATSIQEDIEYEKCVLAEIQSKNTQVVQKLELKTVQIQVSTVKLQNTERQIRHKESNIKSIKQDIKSIYFTLQAQDDSLSCLCNSIEQGLNKQSNHINDIQFVKNDLAHILTQTQKRRRQLKIAEQTQQKLLNYGSDLQYDIKRTQKQLQIEQKGIDEQYWKIQRQNHRLEQNNQMLAQLKQYLQDLIKKNDMLQQSLEEQIIQDHTIKKIVDSKCLQPVGKKTRLFLEQCEDKQFADTNTSWYKQNIKNSAADVQMKKLMSPKQRKDLVQRQVQIFARKGPQQMQFVFDKFINSSQQCLIQQKQNLNQDQNHYRSTGFSYIDRLTKLQAQV